MAKKNKIACFIAMLATLTVITAIASGLEFYFPTYSGLSYASKFTLSPILFGLSLTIWLIISIISHKASWRYNQQNQYYPILGFICGLTPISIISHLNINEVMSFFVILFIAVLWSGFNAKNST